MSTMRLAPTHTKYSLLETMRVPIAVIGSIAFPALALLFFVVLSNSLFSFGLNISEDREKPWDLFLRTLPVSGVSRMLAYIFSVGGMGIVWLLPAGSFCRRCSSRPGSTRSRHSFRHAKPASL
jgi:ABC-2 type transport system permease protein